ncbi:hypothetical protein EDC96DRAFT_517246 [Choanephora cucurbitarum]|nr:hypothetical protein EDC96DRAFT_517246 [Choanephora cucurbitarum]
MHFHCEPNLLCSIYLYTPLFLILLTSDSCLIHAFSVCFACLVNSRYPSYHRILIDPFILCIYTSFTHVTLIHLTINMRVISFS